MAHRFAAACVVGSIVVASGAAVGLLLSLPADGMRVLTLAWCFVPAVWGLWAMLAPRDWIPGRFPLWGAILGVGGGAVAGLVLNLPARFGGPANVGWLALFVGPALYYALWMFVRVVYSLLQSRGQPAPEAASSAHAA